jgi:hypothetical protein
MKISKKSLIIIPSVIFLILSCNSGKKTEKNSIIDVAGAVGKYSVEKLGDYARDIKYIKLETNDSSVLGIVIKIYHEKGLLYISDNNNVCKIFDDNGKYIRTINRIGRGPEEYLDIRDIYVSAESGNMMIMDSRGTITEYTSDGRFIRKIKSPDNEISYVSFTLLKENLFAASACKLNLGEDPESGFIIYDDSLNIYKKIMLKTGKMEQKGDAGGAKIFAVTMDPFVFIEYAGMVKITRNYSDTLFIIEKDLSLSADYIFSFGKFSCDPADIEPGKTDNNSRVITKYSSICENENYIFLNFKMRGVAPESFEYPSMIQGAKPLRNTNVYGIYNKKRGCLTLLKQPIPQRPGLKDDLKGGPPFWPRVISSNNEMIACYNALDLLLLQEERGTEFEGLAKITKDLREEDNPVLAIAK